MLKKNYKFEKKNHISFGSPYETMKLGYLEKRESFDPSGIQVLSRVINRVRIKIGYYIERRRRRRSKTHRAGEAIRDRAVFLFLCVVVDVWMVMVGGSWWLV